MHRRIRPTSPKELFIQTVALHLRQASSDHVCILEPSFAKPCTFHRSVQVSGQVISLAKNLCWELMQRNRGCVSTSACSSSKSMVRIEPSLHGSLLVTMCWFSTVETTGEMVKDLWDGHGLHGTEMTCQSP